MGESKFFTINELSKYISVKPKTLYSWVSKKVIPFYRLQGVLRFKKCEIDQWLNGKCKAIEDAFFL
jgi:excisionase family DNA binding protein